MTINTFSFAPLLYNTGLFIDLVFFPFPPAGGAVHA